MMKSPVLLQGGSRRGRAASLPPLPSPAQQKSSWMSSAGESVQQSARLLGNAATKGKAVVAGKQIILLIPNSQGQARLNFKHL